MNERQKHDRVDRFERLCHERGLPMTSQRRIILEEFLELNDHPSADRVHERVVRRLPEISRTTVYRTLETLAEMGVITKACHPGRAIRYDRRTEMHHHLVCNRCSRILDISDPALDSVPLPDTSALGFRVSDHRVQIRGVCRDCREKEEEAS